MPKGKALVTYEADPEYGTILRLVNGVPITFTKIVDRKTKVKTVVPKGERD